MGTWKMVSVDNLETGISVYKDAEQVGSYCDTRSVCDVIIKLSRDNDELVITGQTITNTLLGHFKVDNEHSIAFEVAMTKIGDAKWSTHFTDSLYLLKNYEVSPKTLCLYSLDRTFRLKFLRI